MGRGRMKKLLVVLIAVMLMFTLTACGNEEVGIEDNRTLEHFVQAFRDAGYEVMDVRGQTSPEVVQLREAVDALVFDLLLGEERILVELWQFDNEDALLQMYDRSVSFSEMMGGGEAKNRMFLMTTLPKNIELNEFFATIE